MATSVDITASAEGTALPSAMSKALDQSLTGTGMTLLLNHHQPPAQPGDGHQDRQDDQQRNHHGSEAETAGPELFVIAQVITHACRDA